MRYYELMMVVAPNVDEEGITAAMERVSHYVDQHNGNVVRQAKWGNLRRLAYPIANFSDGNYVLTFIEMEPEHTRGLEASLGLAPDILRHLLTNITRVPTVPEPTTAPALEKPDVATESTDEATAVDPDAATESTKAK